jgi:uncharacterized protein YbcC (UPF0753/DUF2309 family)
MLAKIANIPEVRQALKESQHWNSSQYHFFIGGEHNTTTDEILLFDSEIQTLIKPIAKVEIKFAKTQQTATQERLAVANNSVAWLIKSE